MKNPAAFAAATLAFLVAPSAFALPIVDVGGVDTLVAYGTVSPSADSQAEFIAKYFGDVEYTKLGDGSSGESGSWTQASDDADVWYLDFSHFVDINPIAFLIKTGKHVQYAGSTYDTFLYANSNNFAVVDLSIFGRSKGNVEIEMISHVSTGAVPVPEPATLSLLGIGLAAIAFSRRRKQKAV